MSALRARTLFHLFGFPVKADASWLFLSVLITWTFATHTLPGSLPGLDMHSYQIMGVIALIGVLVSIIAHELAHAIIAEHYNMPILSIRLFVFGGVAEMSGPPSEPKGELLMALAGPVMSALMAVFFFSSGLFAGAYSSAAAAVLFHHLAWLNVAIVVFNMLPVFPLDGGRILRAALWRRSGNMVRATRIASEGGAIFGYGLIGYGLYLLVADDNPAAAIWLALMGMFLQSSAQYAVRETESRTMLAGERIGRFLRTTFIPVSPDLTIADLVDGYIQKHAQHVFPVIERSRLIGVITLQDVLALDRTKWPWLHVLSVMTPLSAGSMLTTDMEAGEAFDIMTRRKMDHAMVVNAHDHALVGILYIRDIADYVAVNLRIDQDAPLRRIDSAS